MTSLRKIKDRLEDIVEEIVSGGIFWSEAVSQFEKLFILRVLRESNGNLGKAAKIMGVHRNTLSKKIRKYTIRKRPAG
tara:strand:- start:311 stop:544 length:234 start_codon:yes stop_codon:yes gene_type:complete